MAETIETIEIAKAIKSGLDTALASAYPVYAMGVMTNVDGVIDTNATKNERRNPHVMVVIRELNPLGYTSSIRHFAGRLAVVTNFGDDPFQVDLLTISRAVSAWLASSPFLSLTLRKCDAITIDGDPDVGFEDQLQFMEWNITVHTGNASA